MKEQNGTPPDEGALATAEEFTDLQRQLDEGDVAALEKRVEIFAAINRILVKHTQPVDWLLMTTQGSRGKVAYLGADGAERIAALLGITWSTPKKERQQREGFYIWQFEGHFQMAGRGVVYALGSCSSRDKFFGRSGGEWKPENDVSERDVQMKGFSNWIRNGVSRLLGLRNLGEGFFGPEFWKQIPKVEFEGGGKGGSSKKQTPEEEKVARECWDFILGEAGGDEEKARENLAKGTAFEGRDGKPVPGLREWKALTGKRLQYLHERIMKAKAKKGKAAPAPEPSGHDDEPPEPGSEAGFDTP